MHFRCAVPNTGELLALARVQFPGRHSSATAFLIAGELLVKLFALCHHLLASG
jgi:hypothetical protein